MEGSPVHKVRDGVEKIRTAIKTNRQEPEIRQAIIDSLNTIASALEYLEQRLDQLAKLPLE
jgi:hypothetical protein